MDYVIEIKGVDVTGIVKTNSISIRKAGDNRSECNFDLITTAAGIGSDDGAFVGKDIKIKEGITIIFGGVCKAVEIRKLESGPGDAKKLIVNIFSDGYNEIPARRTISGYYAERTAGYIVEDTITNVLNVSTDDENIGIGQIDDGADLPTYLVVCKSVKEVFDELAEASGYKWYIDSNKDFYFIQDDTAADAPYELVEASPAFTDFNVRRIGISLENYRNKQFVRGEKDDAGEVISYIESDDTEIATRKTIEGSAYSSGVYGNTIQSNNTWSEADAETIALNALKRYGKIPYTIEFTSNTNVWDVGQKLKVNLPSVGISSDMYFLIEKVDIEDLGTSFVSYVTATRRNNASFSTQRTETYKDYFAKMIADSKSTGSKYALRVYTVDTTSALTVDVGSYDVGIVTALASNITLDITGIPNAEFSLMIRLKDNGTARGITWGSIFAADGVGLPSVTPAGKWLRLLASYCTVTSKFRVIAVGIEE